MLRTIAFIVALVASTAASADQPREVLEMEIEANVEDVWAAFTTSDGLKLWTTPLVEIDFKVGGVWKANYNPKGKLGDESTIENSILSYDPQRMLSIKATKYPEGFPFAEAARSTWSVFYFDPVSPQRTKITVVGSGMTTVKHLKRCVLFLRSQIGNHLRNSTLRSIGSPMNNRKRTRNDHTKQQPAAL